VVLAVHFERRAGRLAAEVERRGVHAAHQRPRLYERAGRMR
jgi:hypothetical protein